MASFATLRLPAALQVVAPDGSDVRVLLSGKGGSMAHFELGQGRVAQAMTHKTVEEIWYVVSGRGQIWRKLGDAEETVALEAGVCLKIPVGTHFQFRAASFSPVCIVAITMPPWPGPDEAVAVAGPWKPSAR